MVTLMLYCVALTILIMEQTDFKVAGRQFNNSWRPYSRNENCLKTLKHEKSTLILQVIQK